MLHAESMLRGITAEPDRIVVRDGDRALTGAEFGAMIYRIGRALEARGLKRGDGVAILERNTPEVMAARIAAELIGCFYVMIYRRLADDRKAELLARTAVKIVLGTAQDTGFSRVDLAELATHPDAEPLPVRGQAGDLASIRLTGGSTGLPKGILHRVHLDQHEEWSLFAGATMLLCTPIAHAGGGIAEFVLALGGSLIMQPEFDARAAAVAVERHQVTHMWLLPSLVYELADVAEEHDLSSLRMIGYGGWRAAPHRLAEVARRLGPVHQFYGMAEINMISVLRPEEHADPARNGSVGKPLPFVQVEIRDAVDGVGDIWVKSDQVMEGYYQDPDTTARTLVDGWLSTGDRGSLDADGYLTISGRSKEIIIVRGGHVYPRDVEAVLLEYPGVREALVFGTTDKDGAESVHAAVVGTETDPGRLADWVEERRGALYRPRTVLLLDELPRTGVDKPDVQRLAALITQ
ncbi:fatty acid--CoA ligase [Pseudonocardiaceae bacterium YIM PH 21723]|nr:fatty acid--CoA ligase [Pseudonocardiaceae bacterium YIM PH 21723]